MRRKARTELWSLEQLEFRLRCQHVLHSLNILLLFEARKDIKVVLGLDEGSTRQRNRLSITFSLLVVRRENLPASQRPSLFQRAHILKGHRELKTQTYSVSITFLPCCFLWSITALMSTRASESVRVGTLWNSPSFSSMLASSSPVGFSRWRDVDDRAAMFDCKMEAIDRSSREEISVRYLRDPDKIRSY